ncbi:UDP-glucose 4-epimerase [Candidatus Gottesmanbacteria bacterium RIFCSPHIGHO2_02_FULL_40_13]|uniref:UDP-glucose 4-epimerase n=1 Tax=Candidatus Gottesmanbacteria bacterium RIFCSPHIGHO2_02_FULL_40_13 TaxID=1798384 RepID=A0A1F6A6A6_9BACT|nr:MAG: UDP-glucose 4-epimerase [Candidatus Gottesmanbacteria bacterium RIFCSPHIGHO2_02_FULL_40_13]
MTIKKVLITGGAGYVGAVLVPKLLQKGFQVKVLDWYIYGKDVFNKVLDRSNLIEIKGDIRDDKLLARQLIGVDAVIHLAAISNDPSFELDRKLSKEINYDASISLVKLSKRKKVKRYIYVSTSSVYGVKSERNVSEDLICDPLTDYSRYKLQGEKFALAQRSDEFTVCVLRPATICGYSPRLRLDLTVNMLTIQALVNKKITVYGGGQKRPNIHIEDITDLYVQSLRYPAEKINGEIFNAGYDNMSVLGIAELVKSTLNDSKIEIEVTKTDDLRSYHISSKKIREALGFIPKKSIKDAILDLKKAYFAGKILNPLTDKKFYNIQTMKTHTPKFTYVKTEKK